MSAKPGFAALQQAADWYARLADAGPDDEQHQLWQQWLAESDEHRQAWRHVENVSQRFQPLRENARPRPVAEVLLRPQAAEPERRRALKLAALLTTGSLLCWATWRYTPAGESLLALSADYQSRIGEVKALTLSDGTRIWLNTDSALNSDYSADRRRLRLLLGEVLIDTAADARRPFFIDGPQGQMRALGTRFSVRLLPELTRLEVYEGAVEVTPARAAAPLRVTAGSQLLFNRDGAQSLTPSLSQDADWRQGMLRADNLRLSDFIRELSRYRRGHLACDPAIADLRVMGTWPLHDTDRALAMLEQALPVSVNRRFSWWVTVERKKNQNL